MKKQKSNLHTVQNGGVATGENSVIFAYGKAYDNFEELMDDDKLVKENVIALLHVIKKT